MGRAFLYSLMMAAAAVCTVDAVTVSGTVTDSTSGDPLADVVVSLRTTGGFGGGTTLVRDTTDASGAYSLTRDTTGSFSVRASLDGYVTKSVTVTLAADPVTQDIALAAITYATVSGTVTAGGSPLSGAVVSLRGVFGFGQPRRDTVGSDGAFSFDSVASGSYTVSASAATYVTVIDSITVAASDVTNDFALVAAVYSSVSGTVTDSVSGDPLDSVVVSLRFGAGGGTSTYLRDTTGADGAYSFDSVQNGAYTLRGAADGYVTKEVDLTTSGTDAVTQDIALSGTQISSISGTVTDSLTGDPIAGVAVALREGNNTLMTDTTDSSGAYSFDSVETGSYSIRARLTGYDTKYVDVEFSGAAPQTVDVAIVPAAGVISGRDGLGGSQPSMRVVSSGTLCLGNLRQPGVVKAFNADGRLVLRRSLDAGTAFLALPENMRATGGVHLFTVTQGNTVYRARLMVR